MLAVDDEEKSFRMPPEHRGYYELAIAIIQIAVDDYRHWRKIMLIDEGNKSARAICEELQDFFLSDTFEVLSGTDPYQFMSTLDSQIEKEVAENIRRKRLKRTSVIR